MSLFEQSNVELQNAQTVNAVVSSESQWLSEVSLEQAIEAIEAEVNEYQNAGLTQISIWLD